MSTSVLRNIQKKFINLLLQPIRVFCLHHVCAEYEPESMNRGDWMPIDEFKRKIMAMRQEGIKFISLSDAYSKISNDKLRIRKYAVLTFDDGYASLKEILPWLAEQNIPVTLFINGKYLDGKSYRKNPKEKYLTKDELWALNSPLIEIGNHGWEHKQVTEMTSKEFVESVMRNVDLLQAHSNYIPFWAYTYGTHLNNTDAYLHQQGLVPIYIDGVKNINDSHSINREILL